MNIVKTKNFVIAVAVRLYKVVASKMGVNGADKQVIIVTITAIMITIIMIVDNDKRVGTALGRLRVLSAELNFENLRL